MQAKIFKPARTAMQSGTRGTRQWRLEFEDLAAPGIEPLMGWTSGTDMRRELRLDFPTLDEAIAYARRHGITYRVEDERSPRERKIAYSDNFRTDRAAPWTH